MDDARDLLSLIAELGVGFAGFLAIFLIFARREGRFSPADSIRVRAIIAASFIAVFMALVPLLLWQSALSKAAVWRASSIVSLVVTIVVAVTIGRRQLALSPEEQAQVGLMNNVIAWGLAALAAILLAVNSLGVIGEPSALLYSIALVMSLGIATSNFVTVAIHRLL